MSAEIHAGRTQHVSFSETTEAIQPLTDEEKAAKVWSLCAVRCGLCGGAGAFKSPPPPPPPPNCRAAV